MEIHEIDWSKTDVDDLFREIDKWRRSKTLRNIAKLDEVLAELNSQDIFNHGKFREVRSKVGSQEEWASQIGVSQGTVGNYERSVTYPNKQIRTALKKAIEFFKAKETKKLKRSQNVETDLNPVVAKKTLDDSILSAALTDFRFDEKEQQVVAVAFEGDVVESEIEQIETDKKDLLETLTGQAKTIALSLEEGANANVKRMLESLREYGAECEKTRPNPRKLFRWGSNIARATSRDDIVFGISDWDKTTLDGFADDHNELMRLYYKEALAKAQQVDAAVVPDEAELPQGKEFLAIADVIESAVDEDGNRLFASDIATLLRDIGREASEQEEAEILTSDEARKVTLRKRRVEAIKNGSILVGRFLFFTSFFIVIDPGVALSTAGSIASILGLIETSLPGTVRGYYDKLRQGLPFLPKLPTKE